MISDAKAQNLSVVVLSGTPLEKIIDAAKDAGADLVFQKPGENRENIRWYGKGFWIEIGSIIICKYN